MSRAGYACGGAVTTGSEKRKDGLVLQARGRERNDSSVIQGASRPLTPDPPGGASRVGFE